MKTTKLLLLFCLLVGSFSQVTYAGEVTLIVSVNKKVVSADEVQNAVTLLNFRDANECTCFVNTKVTQYIDYTQLAFRGVSVPYYGIALVDFQWQCDEYAKKFLDRWQASGKYTIWSNPGIGPSPAVSGSN